MAIYTNHFIPSVRLAALIVAGPFPNADACRAVFDGCIHIKPLRRRMLASDDDIDVVAAAQAVICHREQRVGIRWQVDTDHFGLLVDNVVNYLTCGARSLWPE